MTTPRRLLVDPERPGAYHLVSRCVRRAWLFGRDAGTGRDYSHRRDWLVKRMFLLARSFAVDIYAWAVMSNHFHLVVWHDPKAGERWSDGEVARRWVEAFPPMENGQVAEERKAEARQLLLADAERLARARRTLGSMSDFMKHLKQPIARRANQEDDCTGHFFEQRFYSGALLSDETFVAAMAYVDLNPVRAGLATKIEECRDASVATRVRENSAEALADYLRPVQSGLDDGETPRAPMTAKAYLALLALMTTALTSSAPAQSGTRGAAARAGVPNERVARWLARTAAFAKKQRAYGPLERLREWTADRGLQLREKPLPA